MRRPSILRVQEAAGGTDDFAVSGLPLVLERFAKSPDARGWGCHGPLAGPCRRVRDRCHDTGYRPPNTCQTLSRAGRSARTHVLLTSASATVDQRLLAGSPGQIDRPGHCRTELRVAECVSPSLRSRECQRCTLHRKGRQAAHGTPEHVHPARTTPCLLGAIYSHDVLPSPPVPPGRELLGGFSRPSP